MNEIMANIKSRRSRREFLDRDIAEGAIEEMIEAGRYAPSALNRQPWKFIVVTNKDIIRKLSSIVKEKTSNIVRLLPVLRLFIPSLRNPQITGAIKKTISSENDTVFYSAPLLILIVSDKKSGRYASKDCALASQNMMLYAHSVGIGSCFIGRADFLMASNAAKGMIGLPPNHVIQCAIVFGYPPQGELSIPQRKTDNIINRVR